MKYVLVALLMASSSFITYLTTKNIEPLRTPYRAGSGYGQTVYGGSGDINQVALTFDDCWKTAKNPSEYFQHLVTVLKEKNAKANFFLTGRCAEKYGDWIKQLHSNGHLIGSHSYNHENFANLDANDAAKNLAKTREAFRNIGVEVRPFFRFPYGYLNKNSLQGVLETGYTAFFWNLHTFGLKGSRASVQKRIAGLVRPGSIILLHLQAESDIYSLAEIIDIIRSKGLEPVRLDTLLESA